MQVKKRLFPIFLLLIFFISFFQPNIIEANASAKIYAKDEVVYGTLFPNGDAKAGYIINVFEVEKAGRITDYGRYSEVKNLTNLEKITKEKNEVQAGAEEGKFYYQGNVENIKLPWNFSIEYMLNGKRIEAEELLGANGRVTMTITTKANEEVDPHFFEHFLLQITFPFDREKFSQIEAQESTIANVGKTEQVIFTVLPEEEATFTVQAKVEDFEFTGVEIVALPFLMAIDHFETDGIEQQISSLEKAIDEIDDGVLALKDGLFELNKGSEDLADGSLQYKYGLQLLHRSSSPLRNGSHEIYEALQSLQRELSDSLTSSFSEFELLLTHFDELSSSLYSLAKQLTRLKDGYDEMYEKMEKIIATIPERKEELELTREDYTTIIASGIPNEKLDYLIEHYIAAQTIKGFFNEEEVLTLFSQLGVALKEASEGLENIAKTIEQVKRELEESIDEMTGEEGTNTLEHSLNQFVSSYEQFHTGIVEYTEGVDQLTTIYDDVHRGIKDLHNGTTEIKDGSEELQEGTSTLYQETRGLPKQMEAGIDEFLNSYKGEDFVATSFMSEKNKKIETVQFILQTEGINHPGIEVKEEKKEKARILESFEATFYWQ